MKPHATATPATTPASARAVHPFRPASWTPAGERRPTQAEMLEHRMIELEAQRRAIAEEVGKASTGGDMADRSFNVDALVHLEQLDEQLSVLAERLSDCGRTITAPAAPAAVSLRFPPQSASEEFVVGYLSSDLTKNVITVDSPLGRALVGARPGDEITYRAPNGRPVTVIVTAVEP